MSILDYGDIGLRRELRYIKGVKPNLSGAMNAENKLWYLENIDFFKDLSKDQVKELMDLTVLQDCKKGEYIYFQDDIADKVYFVKKGKVKIGTISEDGKEIIKAILQNGEVFGEQVLLGDDRHNDFAQVSENSCLLVMKKEDFKSLILKNQILSFRITEILGQKLKKIEKKLESLIFLDARTRIVEFLREMATEYGQRVGYETLVHNSLTHQDIAKLTATSRQTVTTVLNELREQNQIYFDRKRILIRDIGTLA